jgi:hypothetical protein
LTRGSDPFAEITPSPPHRLTALPPTFNRRTATRVRNGEVQRKNRHRPTGHNGYVFARESPGRGFRHVVSLEDVRTFIELIPDWDRYSERLARIVLARPMDGWDAAHEFSFREETGAIFLYAWSEDLWVEWFPDYFDSHEPILQALGVSTSPADPKRTRVICRFTAAQARAFMLLHVFLHELGHHYDHIHQKHHSRSRGEDYAERFANDRFASLFPAYVQAFGSPVGSG